MFVVGGPKIQIQKCTFLALFQISDVKPELSPVKLKVCKNGIFWAKNLFQKNFPRLFLFPNQSYVKKLGQKGP